MDEHLEKIRERMTETDRMEDSVARNVAKYHITSYFGATEAERKAVAELINEAETTHQRVLAVSGLPIDEWNSKWPPAVRAAMRALWNTPKE